MADALTQKQHSAIERARLNPDLRRILFRKAAGLKWYDAFRAAGFIVPSEIPKPVPAKEEGYVSIPHWLITDYLVAASSELSKPENRRYAVEFLEFIRATTRHAQEHDFGNYRVWWQFSKIIRNIPVDLLTEEDNQKFDYWLNDPYEHGIVAESLALHWLSILLDRTDAHAHTLAIGVLEVLYRVTIHARASGESTRKEVAFRFDAWHARKITTAIACKSGAVLGLRAVSIFKGRIEEMLTHLENDRWSAIWRPAIEDHEQNRAAQDSDNVLIDAFRDSLVAFVEHEPTAARVFVATLLNSSLEVIRRVAIHAIDRRYDDLRVLVNTVVEGAYFDSGFRHEVWHLLRNHYPQFPQETKEKTLSTIESLIQTDESGNEHKSATAYERARWLAAIKDHDESVMASYRVYVQMAGGAPEHPDFSSYTSSGWVGSESPIPVEQLRSMELPELVKTLDSYRDPNKFREPGIEGLTKALRQAVKSEPTRFYKALVRFSSLDFAYVYPLIEAYAELWNEKAQLVWDEIWPHLFAFCEALIEQPRFWATESAQERANLVANRYWIVGAMARLIESGTQSDDHAFAADLLPQAEKILGVLLDNEAGEKFEIESDAVSVAINSPRGRCLEGLINLTLRSCRLAESETERARTWARFEPRYESELARANRGEYEFATLVVNYLPNFLYMSKAWVQRNLDRIFDAGDEQAWLCAMQAYAYVNRVYPEIYGHLKEGGHFIRALDDSRLKDKVDEKIVQNIALAYLIEMESLADETGLLRYLLQRKNPAELSHLIWFFWSLRNHGKDDNVRRKALELWPHIVAAIDVDSREGRKVASRLCDWIVFVDEVDKATNDLILSAVRFAADDHHSSEVLEGIARISERQPHEAQQIWMHVLETAQPDYPIEAVRQALTNILRMGDDGERKAKAVVSRYIAAGNDDVQAVWKELAPPHPE